MPVLFDLDGTLLDTAPDFAFILNQMRQEQHLLPLSLEAIKPSVSEGLNALLYLCFNVNTEHPQHQSLRTQFMRAYQSIAGRFTQPFPGMLELLLKLDQAQIPWGVVTNKNTCFTEAILKSLQLIERCACIVCGDTTAHMKPHPASLLYACETLRVSPTKCVYIGDALRDIQAGKAAGMKTIGALFGYITNINETTQWQADYYANTVEDIYPWIQQWMTL